MISFTILELLKIIGIYFLGYVLVLVLIFKLNKIKSITSTGLFEKRRANLNQSVPFWDASFYALSSWLGVIGLVTMIIVALLISCYVKFIKNKKDKPFKNIDEWFM